MTTVLQRNLQQILQERRISAYTLEKRAHLKSSAIQNILQGKSRKPSAELVLAIAQNLECSVEELFQTHDSNEVSTGRKKWIPSLYVNVLETIQSILEKKQIELNKSSFLKLVEEAYLYSLEGDIPHADNRFCDWLVARYVHNQKDTGPF